MSDKKYRHYVAIPITARALFSFESDAEQPDWDEVAETFYNDPEVSRLTFLDKDGGRSGTLLEEWDIHEHLNRGNVCYVVCPEWDLDETEEITGDD